MFFTSVNDHFKVFSMKLEIFQNIRLLFIYYLQPNHFTPKSDITGLSRGSPHCQAQHGKAKLFKKIRKESFRFRISLEKNQFELPVLHLHPFYSFQNFLNFWLTVPTMESIHFLVRHWIWTETHHLFKFIFAWTPWVKFLPHRSQIIPIFPQFHLSVNWE